MPTAGYFWIEGTYLHYIDASGVERGQEGTVTGASGTAGYLWIEGNYIHYIDASGDERYLPYSALTDTGTGGYLWIEGDWVHFIREGGTEAYWHTDTAHSNSADHSNIAHSNLTDHTNTVHTNSTTHSNIAHGDTLWSDWDNHGDNSGCFLAGTKISMADGSLKKIEDIEIGDNVLSFNSQNQLISASVSKLLSRSADCYFLLKTENHQVNVTEEHPFYIGKGFKKIKESLIGDEIYVLENKKLVPEKIVRKDLIKKQVKIYNLKVEISQTYFANGFAVHNKDPWADYDDWSETPHVDVGSEWSDHADIAYIDWDDHSNVAYVDSSDHSNSVHVDAPVAL